MYPHRDVWCYFEAEGMGGCEKNSFGRFVDCYQKNNLASRIF